MLIVVLNGKFFFEFKLKYIYVRKISLLIKYESILIVVRREHFFQPCAGYFWTKLLQNQCWKSQLEHLRTIWTYPLNVLVELCQVILFDLQIIIYHCL